MLRLARMAALTRCACEIIGIAEGSNGPSTDVFGLNIPDGPLVSRLKLCESHEKNLALLDFVPRLF